MRVHGLLPQVPTMMLQVDVCVDGEYRMTRIEYRDDWNLYGLFEAGNISVGLKIRVYN